LLHTNLTHFPQGLLKKFERFRGISLAISLDGYGDVNSYIRYPSDWGSLVKNMEILNDWAVYPFRKVYINVTVQAYNILDLPNFLEFAISSFPNFQAPNLSRLVDPREFDCLVLPQGMRTEAAVRIRSFLKGFTARHSLDAWTDNSLRDFFNQLSALAQELESGPQGDLETFI